MESTEVVLPKGAWQQPHPTLAVCPHHAGNCAYRVGDPDRCDRCHVDWATVRGKWHESVVKHVADHTATQDRSAAKAAARAAKAAAEPARKPAQNGRQTLNGVKLG